MSFKSNFGYTFSSAEIVTDTNVHEGRIGAVVALDDSKIDVLESPMMEFISTDRSSAVFPVAFKKNCEIEGIITKIQLKTGQVILYYI